MYKILNGELLGIYDIIGSSNFRTEVMYGSGGFYATVNGSASLICQFIVGRNLPRYAVMVKACEMLSETGNEEILVNNSPEKFCPECGRPYLYGSVICPFCMKKLEVYMKLWAMTKGLRLAMFFPFIVATVGILMQFILPIIMRHITDTYFVPKSSINMSEIDAIIRGFVSWIALLVAIDLVQRSLGVVEGRLLAVASGKFLIMLRTLLYEKIQTLSLSSIHKHSTGDLMTRVSSDTSAMQTFIIREFPSIFRQVVSLPIAVVILFVMNWITALFVIVPIPFAIFIITQFWDYIHSKNRRQWVAGTRLYYLLHDILNGVRVVKSFGQEDKEIEKFNKASLDVATHAEIISRIWSTIWPFVTFLINAGTYLIVWYAGQKVINKEITMGEYNQFFAYAGIVYGPLTSLANIPNSISHFLTSSSKVFEILEETPEILDIDLPIDIKIEGDISINKATFGYQSYSPVLENVSLDIKAGEMIGIVGHSGSGKTTLINLLMRLYDVNEGEILIDGVNIKDISQEALRSQIGVVLQETHLFTGTVRENIRYSKPYASDEEVIEAARVANAHDFIVNLPEGYNTLVGEKGYSMSGGERQRVAIARAVIHNPSILILDEATASLDTETEKMIQDSLNRLSENRTTIAIAHRLSTLRNANRLLVLDKGKVAEYGTHNELLDAKGIYYKLVMAQREMAHQIVGEEADEPA
jgi:ATP-binding cassette subfamily B protein